MADPTAGNGPLLTGVGVGPGDPQLLTLAGLAALRDADLVVVPVRDDVDEVGYAERVVRHHLPDARIARAPFALTEREGVTPRRAQAWDAAAALVVDAFAAGAATIAFATIGDPNVYSTFGYLAASVLEGMPTLTTRTVPGVTAMQALAAASGTVLCEGREPLVLMPVLGDPAELDAVLACDLLAGATVVAYKGGRRWPALRDVLAARGRLAHAVVGSHLGRPDESVGPATAVDAAAGAELPYLSTVLAPPARGGRGGKL
ncbi:precorrin-2 C(20)-methyltransferase [uncultured Jatrophihabitans sp.]|uniref:precorrin-2 C(20)-methyltransferase n=1 Tax=uncultured Jatrophihabitans sp. TaxID=1610747 RepID=UPI0035CA2E86